MHQVQDFRANFAQADVENSVTDPSADDTAERAELHDTDSQVRNVCFVWENGRRAFFNYAYLISVDLMLEDSLNVMLLYFSGQIVTLKGYHLGLLFDLLLSHIPKTIAASNSRYDIDGQTQEAFVTEIFIRND